MPLLPPSCHSHCVCQLLQVQDNCCRSQRAGGPDTHGPAHVNPTNAFLRGITRFREEVQNQSCSRASVILFPSENGVYVLLFSPSCTLLLFSKAPSQKCFLSSKILVKKNWKCHLTEPAACQLSTVTPRKCIGTNYFYNTHTLQSLILPTF